jgi:iron(III) transport system ATP-binding protein
MLEVKNLSFEYRGPKGSVQAVSDVSFKLEKGEFYSLLGPSGCGKSTTLRCVAGLERPSTGQIVIGGETVFCGHTRRFVSANKRNIGMVFQSYAVWPHLSVLDNVLLPLTKGRRRLANREARERAMAALSLVHLDSFADRMAPMLSGGQQQRVAVARAFALEPAVLLLDEPLSNLDTKLREEMRAELKSLVKRLHVTALYVTHDQGEALAMSDRFAVMLNGRIVQAGTPTEMYGHPRTAFVASFLGKANLIPGMIHGASPCGQGIVLQTAIGQLISKHRAKETGNKTVVLCRPEDVVVLDSTAVESKNAVTGKVVERTYQGHCVELVVDCMGHRIRAMEPGNARLALGHEVVLQLPPEHCQAIEA